MDRCEGQSCRDRAGHSPSSHPQCGTTTERQYQEFLRFLRQITRAYPERELHLVMDNDAAHEHPAVRTWLAANPRGSGALHPDLRVLDEFGRVLVLDHNDRRVAARARDGEPLEGPSREAEWVDTTPTAMAERALAGFPQRFAWALEDLAALDTARPVLAEGWGLRPELVAEIVDDRARMVVLVATEDFRAHQQRHLDRARGVDPTLSDPDRAQRNRLERDRLPALDVTRRARELGVTVIEVDGTRGPEAVADLLDAQFAPFL